MRWARCVLAVVAAACSREPRRTPVPAATQAPVASVAVTASAAPAVAAPPLRARSAREPVRSCPAPRGVTDVTFDPRIDVGWAGDVSWLFGYAGEDAVLAHLDAAGRLAKTPVPLHNAQAAAVSEDRIWLYAPTEGPTVPTRWTSVDVSRPDAPVTSAVEPVTVGARLDHARALGVGRDRALVVTGVPDEVEIVLVDTARRAAVLPPIAIEKGFVPVRAWCHVDRCAVVAITDEGGGPKRRLAVLRVDAAGVVEREQLAPDWIGRAYVAEAGDDVVLAWSDHDGLRVRRLDLWGRPRGPAVDAGWGAGRFVRHDALVQGPGGLALAAREQALWSTATISGSSVGPFRDVAGAERYFLVGVNLDDGLVWTSHGSNVDYRPIGTRGMTHSWSAAVVAGFAPTGASPATRDELANEAGPGRGGLEPFLLARPGGAAALVVARGDADRLHGRAGGRLTLLRRPCP